MAWQLVVEVLDHAPPDLTAAELLVLVALAEKMPRRGPYDYTTRHLMRRTRLKERGLRAAVERLAGRGIDVRVPIGVDKRGRPLYAAYGLAPRWKLPAFDPPDGCLCDSCEVSRGGAVVPPTSGGGTTASSEAPSATLPGTLSAPQVDTTVPPTPSVPKAEDGGQRPPWKARPKPAPSTPPKAGECPTHKYLKVNSLGLCAACQSEAKERIA